MNCRSAREADAGSLPAWGDTVLGGWQLGGIVTLRTGEYRAPSSNASPTLAARIATVRTVSAKEICRAMSVR